MRGSRDERVQSDAVSRPTALEHFQFVGDKRTQIVYDIDLAGSNEEVAKAVADIVANETYACFAPDTVDEARNRGYKPHKSIIR